MVKTAFTCFVLSLLIYIKFSYASNNAPGLNKENPVKQKESVTLLLPWKHQFQFAGYYMAKEKGLYQKAGIEIKIKEYQLNNNNTDIVMNNKNYFGIGHSSLILDKINRYPDILLLAAIHQSSPLVLLAKKRKDLQNVHDFANKKVMITNDQTYNAAINAMLVAEKLPQNTFKRVKTTFNPIDLINGYADLMTAYISNEPFTLKERGIEYTLFDPKDYGFNFYSDILFTSKALLKKNPELVEAFYKATIKGWYYAYQHIQETIDIIYNRYNSQNKSKKALLFEAEKLKTLAFLDKAPIGNITIQRLQVIAQSYLLVGLVNESRLKHIDFSDFIYSGNKYSLSELEIPGNTIPLLKPTDSLDDIAKWFSINYINTVYPYLIWTVFSSLFFIFIVSLFFINKFKQQFNRNTNELNQQLELFDNYISASRTDINGVITYASKEFSRISGYSEKELIGQPHSIVKSNDTPQQIYQELWMTLKSGHTWKGEIKNRNKQGKAYWINAIISPIYSSGYNKISAEIIGYEAIHRNITEEKLLQNFSHELEQKVQKRTQQLRNSEKYLDTLFNVNPNIAYVSNGKQIVRANKAFFDFTGFSSLDEFLKKHQCVFELFEIKQGYLSSDFNLKKYFESLDADKKHPNKAIIKRNNQETIFSLNLQFFLINKQQLYLVILENITELENIAINDKLTQVYNRIYLDQIIDYQIKQLLRYQIHFSLMIVDIDYFKKINDTYGHQRGDRVLKSFAQLLKNNIRKVDVLGRWGGEEFMIICPQSNIKGSMELAEKIRHQIENFDFQLPQRLTASFGIAHTSLNMDEQQLIEKADKALYQAKKQGRNQVVYG